MNDDIEFDLEKFKAAVHYLISKCNFKDNVERTVLYELLYFSDFDCYEINEEAITGEKYIKKPRGPLPIHFTDAVLELKNEGKIQIHRQDRSDYVRYRYSSACNPDISSLEDGELELIDEVVDRFSNLNSDEISRYSHGDFPWRLAKDDSELNYEAVFYREPEYSVRVY